MFIHFTQAMYYKFGIVPTRASVERRFLATLAHADNSTHRSIGHVKINYTKIGRLECADQ